MLYFGIIDIIGKKYLISLYFIITCIRIMLRFIRSSVNCNYTNSIMVFAKNQIIYLSYKEIKTNV